MKGQGTFRRMLGAALGIIGMGGPQLRPSKDYIADPTARAAEEKRKGTKSRWRGRKHRHTQPRKGWPLLEVRKAVDDYGELTRQPKNCTNTPCPKPLSRKALKHLAPEHPLLVKPKF